MCVLTQLRSKAVPLIRVDPTTLNVDGPAKVSHPLPHLVVHVCPIRSLSSPRIPLEPHATISAAVIGTTKTRTI